MDLSKKQKTYAIDAVSGITAACCVAPGMAIVDIAVTEKSADPKINLYRNAFRNFKSMFTSPRSFFTTPTFIFVCVVYGGTYTTANMIQSYCEFKKKDPKYMKLGGTTAVNMFLGVLKDRYIAQRYGIGPVRPFPLPSWGLFVLRDTLTIGCGFIFPPPISNMLIEKGVVKNKVTADNVAQIFVPLFAQFFLTPIHLLSLDIYNHLHTSSLSERATRIRTFLFGSWSIRILRTLCAYSIAGVANSGFKQQLRTMYL